MEKQGVCPGENEAPEVKKAATEQPHPTKEANGCCKAPQSCGDDPISRAADAVADKK